MSRIWEAIKQARRERSQEEAGEPQAGRDEPWMPVERRSFMRRSHQADLLVYGSGEDKQPFHEEAATLDASDNGCLMVLHTIVAPGQRLFLTNAGTQAEQECRVVHVNRRAQGTLRVGVEFSHPVSHFWNLAGTR